MFIRRLDTNEDTSRRQTEEIIENEAEKDTDGKLKEVLRDVIMLNASNTSN